MKKTKPTNQLTPTEAALFQSEERYKAFISQSTEGIWRCELEKPLSIKDPIKKQLAHIFTYGYLAECNDAMAQMYGFKRASELENIRLKDIMVPTDEENISYLTDFIKSNFKLQRRQSHELDKYGHLHIFENNLMGVIENGHVLRAWGTQRDITEQVKAKERQEFLEKVTNKLVVSINHHVTLQEIAQLIVPYLADYCRIAIVDKDNTIKEITVNHKDPTAISLAEALYDSYKDLPTSTYGVPKILQTGKPEIIEKINDKILSKYAANKQLIKIIKQIGLQSYMGVPLIARGKIIGAITFSSIKKQIFYTKTDLQFAGELARRIALTLDNIQLFQEAQEEIQERERIAETLRLQQERLHLAQEAGNIGVFEWDIPSDIVQWSPQLEKLYGLHAGEFTGNQKQWLDMMHPDDRERIVKEFNEQIKNSENTEFEFRIILPDTTVRWIYGKAQVFFDGNKKPMRVVGINVDVSQRKQAIINSLFLAEASKILSSSLDYETTLKNVASLAVSQIADWCSIEMINKEGALQQIAVIHKNPEKVVWALKLRKDYPTNLQADVGIAKILKTGKSELYPSITEAMIKRSARDSKHLKLLKQIGMTSVMMTPLLSEQKPVGVITFISSEAKRQFTKGDLLVADELAIRASLAIDNAKLYKKAQEAVSLRDDFISVASHELKTPVTSVKIFTQVLLKHAKKAADEKSITSLEKMDKQIDKLTDLIYNLLNISKIQSGRLEFEKKSFVFDDMITEVIDVMQHMAVAHKIILKGKSNCMLYGDEDRLSQVVSNLISNAIKYSPHANKVVISVAVKGEHVKVSVRDFGIGMNKEHLDKVFGRFYRVSSNEDKTFPGLGIGLYISKEIINRHNGKLWVGSTEGGGSTFHFTIPLKS